MYNAALSLTHLHNNQTWDSKALKHDIVLVMFHAFAT
jgi:hypothetical protein